MKTMAASNEQQAAEDHGVPVTEVGQDHRGRRVEPMPVGRALEHDQPSQAEEHGRERPATVHPRHRQKAASVIGRAEAITRA
jgi:hypothetical protein